MVAGIVEQQWRCLYITTILTRVASFLKDQYWDDSGHISAFIYTNEEIHENVGKCVFRLQCAEPHWMVAEDS